VGLLKKTCPVVKAVAVVDSVEKFWPQKEGEEILKATTKDSTRVFVFREREHLNAHLPILQRHAAKYNVHALSFNRLAAEYPEYAQDFSIIGGTTTPLLAYYVESPSRERGGLPLKMIRFSASPLELSRHEEAMTGILNISSPIEPLDFADEIKVDALLDKLFTPEFKEFGKKQVEMSAYIEIDQYDAHEEEHAYYPEMMDKMISIVEESRDKGDARISVLEVGAGTGIFTKRLAALSNLDITALEIDWACFYLLKKNMAACQSKMRGVGTNFTAANKDSRKVSEQDKFKFILSSFSDHHIYFLDKAKYLRSIRKSLLNDGMFIVGDEFLPEHDETDANARKDALEAYHRHIIEIARKEDHPILMELEERALESGLRGWGDFKVSCGHYEDVLAEVGFKIVAKEKIGPIAPDDIGGVYVYAVTK
jgi:SAM-dependent methyltransferase